MTKQNHRLNAVWGLINALTDIFCGMYTSRLLLNAYGPTAHGLINAINNFLGLVLALEFTFMCIGRTNYYRALESHDQNLFNAVYRRDKRALRRGETWATLSTVVIAFIFPLFYGAELSYWDTVLLVLALGLYVLVRTGSQVEVTLLVADYKSYVTKIMYTLTTLLTTAVCYGCIQWGCSLLTVKIAVALVLLIHPLFYHLYVRRHYHPTKPSVNLPPLRRQPIIMVERMTNIVLARTDVFVLAVAATLTDVSIYAVYYMVAKNLSRCISACFTGREVVYGHAFIQQDTAAVKKAYNRTSFLLANLLGIGFGTAMIMLNPFVALYTKWVRGVNYHQFWFGFWLLMAQLLACIRESQMKVIYASGKVRHKQILFDAIMEAVINVVVSLVLVIPYGVMGVAIGTVVALAYRVLRLLIYRRHHILKGSLWRTLRRFLPTVCLLALGLVLNFYFPPHPHHRMAWLLDALQFTGILLVADLLLQLLFNFKDTKSVLICAFYAGRDYCRAVRKTVRKVVRKTRKTITRGVKKLGRGIAKRVRNTVHFVWKALGGIYQRGLFRAVQAYFSHHQVQKFTAAHPDMPDLPYLTTIGKLYCHTKMDLTNPQTLNEKINWLKINYHHPLITTMSDKVAAKDYFAQTMGESSIIPTYGVWDSFDDIAWDSLPNAFVLKCTHDSGSIYIVKDKTQLDDHTMRKLRRHFEHYLHYDYWRKLREWGYRYVPPRIIAEKYLPTLGHRTSTEYKFTCFNGKVVFGTVCSGFAHGFNKRRVNDFYDRDFHHLPWRAWYRNDRHRPQKPAQWAKMIEISEKFAQDFPYLRVDLYVVDEQIYFGEFTFYTGGGFIEFHPKKMDLILGQQLVLPAPRFDGDRAEEPVVKDHEPAPSQVQPAADTKPTNPPADTKPTPQKDLAINPETVLQSTMDDYSLDLGEGDFGDE